MAVKLLLAALFLLLFAWPLFPAKVFAAFTIETVTPSDIISEDQTITLFVSASNLSSSTQYLQTAITKEGKTNYFGFTQNNSGNWIQYQSSPDLNSLLAFTPVDGNWNGEVKAKIDTSDSGFAGPGSYMIKVLKYISSSPSSSNLVPLTINIATSPETTPEAQSPSPTVQFSLPDNLTVGKEFEITFTTSNIEPGSYYVKSRMGVDSSHLTLGQTFNSEWLGDTDSWSKFPQVSSSSKVKVRLSPTASAGNHVLKVRLKKTDSDKIYDSEEKTVNFTQNPNPPQTSKTPPKSPTPKTPTPAQSQKTGAVLATVTKTSTIEAQINEHLKSVDLLATVSGINKAIPKKKPLNLLLTKPNEENTTIFSLVATTGGLVLLGGSGIYLFRKRFFGLSQDE